MPCRGNRIFLPRPQRSASPKMCIFVRSLLHRSLLPIRRTDTASGGKTESVACVRRYPFVLYGGSKICRPTQHRVSLVEVRLLRGEEIVGGVEHFDALYGVAFRDPARPFDSQWNKQPFALGKLALFAVECEEFGGCDLLCGGDVEDVERAIAGVHSVRGGEAFGGREH